MPPPSQDAQLARVNRSIFVLIAVILIALLLWAALTRSPFALEALLQFVGYSLGFVLAWLAVRLLGRGWLAAVVLLLVFFASYVGLVMLPLAWRVSRTGGGGSNGDLVETPLSQVLGGIPAGVLYGGVILILLVRLFTDGRTLRKSQSDQRMTRIAVLVVVGAAVLLTIAAFLDAYLRGA